MSVSPASLKYPEGLWPTSPGRRQTDDLFITRSNPPSVPAPSEKNGEIKFAIAVTDRQCSQCCSMEKNAGAVGSDPLASRPYGSL